MSTSYVEFRGKGFWSWDGYLEDVLQLLAVHPIADTSQEWLNNARNIGWNKLRGHFKLADLSDFTGRGRKQSG